MKEHEEWLSRARSCLALARTQNADEIVREDLCFQAQQSVEKGLKALLIFFGERPPRTHDLVSLLHSVGKYAAIPEIIRETVILNDYAVQMRYPGDYTPVSEEELREAIRLAGGCYSWVFGIIRKEHG